MGEQIDFGIHAQISLEPVEQRCDDDLLGPGSPSHAQDDCSLAGDGNEAVALVPVANQEIVAVAHGPRLKAKVARQSRTISRLTQSNTALQGKMPSYRLH